jgi:methylmalonyl-CoA/ethylmalonyl-CoA epimerase
MVDESTSTETRVPQRFTKVKQVCVVVEDVDKAVERYSRIFGISPWYLFEYRDAVAVLNGQPHTFSVKVALAKIDDYFQWELLQPLDDRSIYYQFLARHGEGVHHIGFEVDDVPEAIEAYGALLRSDNAGLRGGTQRYAMLDTEASLGVLAEVMDYTSGWVRGGAIGVFPPTDEGNLVELDY